MLTLLSSVLLPCGATAQERVQPGDDISVVAGYGWPSRQLHTSGRAFTDSLIYGHPFASSHFALEGNLHGSVFETGIRGYTDYYQYGLNVDGAYRFNPYQDWVFNPFLLAGIGGAYDNFAYYNRGVFLGEAGLGLVTRALFNNGLRLRLDLRWVHDSAEGGHSEYRSLLGIWIPLGWSKPTPPPPPPVVQIREVVKEVVKEVPRQWIDSDGDGVDDEHDRCPNTPHGARVDANGCVIATQTIELRGVTFNLNQATLTPNAETVLDSVAPAFTGQPSLRAEVAGHTDSSGSVAYNLNLSQRRAEAVRSYLISRGAKPEQLTAHGYGKSELLIKPESSETDRERNRRVELRARGQE